MGVSTAGSSVSAQCRHGLPQRQASAGHCHTTQPRQQTGAQTGQQTPGLPAISALSSASCLYSPARP